MQFVADKYYIWYNRVCGVLGILLAIVTVLAWTIPSLNVLQSSWGFTPIIGVIGLGAACSSEN